MPKDEIAQTEELARTKAATLGHELADFAAARVNTKMRFARCAKCNGLVHFDVIHPRASLFGDPLRERCA
jgi:NAD-dependent SIR2 family protein deacetylase